MNLTVSIDEEILREARVRALKDRTSVNALVAATIRDYAAGGDIRSPGAIARILELARSSRAASGAHGRNWTRDELHDRAGDG